MAVPLTALTFARDHAGILAIVVTIAAVLLFAEWRRFRRDQQSLATVHDRLFLAEEVRRALHPEAYAGPTHDDASRDSRGAGRAEPFLF